MIQQQWLHGTNPLLLAFSSVSGVKYTFLLFLRDECDTLVSSLPDDAQSCQIFFQSIRPKSFTSVVVVWKKLYSKSLQKLLFGNKIKFIFWFLLFTIFFIVNLEFFCIIYTLVCFLIRASQEMENAYNFPDLLFYMTS